MAPDDQNICRGCYEKQQRAVAEAPKPTPAPLPQPPPREIEWPDPAQWAALPEPVETVEAELRHSLGEGLGPDDLPDPVSMWDLAHDEKLARLRSYHKDILAGRPIAFIPDKIMLDRPGVLDHRAPSEPSGTPGLPAAGATRVQRVGLRIAPRSKGSPHSPYKPRSPQALPRARPGREAG
ncbi:MAG: hypothetical protein A2Y77_14745 [Planctomycetes bacterium RBG_13_62_9]|nr:MAG: hypothetical protein A2Y77_14745 [Planctomycetes bacterium RBG_13_62_9]